MHDTAWNQPSVGASPLPRAILIVLHLTLTLRLHTTIKIMSTISQRSRPWQYGSLGSSPELTGTGSGNVCSNWSELREFNLHIGGCHLSQLALMVAENVRRTLTLYDWAIRSRCVQSNSD